MTVDLTALSAYTHSLQESLDTGKATEPTHYPALKMLLESLGEGIAALNNPKRIECGAPDFVVSQGSALTLTVALGRQIGGGGLPALGDPKV